MTLASLPIPSPKMTYELNQDSPKEILQMFIRRPEVLDIFYNIKAGTFEGLLVDDGDVYLWDSNRPEIFDLEYTYLPFLEQHGFIHKTEDYPDGKTRYIANYTDIIINPDIGRHEFSHMVLQRSKVFGKSLPSSRPENSIAALLVGTDSEPVARQMVQEFKELAEKWRSKLASVDPEATQARFTLTILGEATCVH